MASLITSGWYPQVKPEHGLHRLPGGRVRIGGSVYGIAAEVLDTTGAIWTTLRAADGTRSAEEIVARVLAAHPTETARAVRAALDQFAAAGYLDDAAAPDPPELTDRDRERYDRSRRFHRWIDLVPRATSWEPQVALKRARAVVVGLGGTGGAVALALAASGVGRLHCVDPDVVELSNLNRQTVYVEDDIGRPKVDAAVARLRRLNSDIEVTGERAEVRGPADLRRLVADRDVLVLCADRPGAIRAWANRVCLDTGTPWVDAGYHGPVVTAAAYLPGLGPCYECFWLAEHDKRRRDDPAAEYTVERESSSAVSAASAGLSGHLAAHLASALLTGVPAVRPGQLQGINLVAADQHFLIAHPPHPRCPAGCGGEQVDAVVATGRAQRR
ncbi:MULTISPECIES: ThiF family adenylyltransferase [Micromonospora]|uniref:ThiF family adenylyltransferase n=1 Tax=Micromonospora TaxID=1873 RepID=UPI000B202CC0|nr:MULTISPECIES: ThiF family adenylyltransferase [Micromonospora]